MAGRYRRYRRFRRYRRSRRSRFYGARRKLRGARRKLRKVRKALRYAAMPFKAPLPRQGRVRRQAFQGAAGVVMTQQPDIAAELRKAAQLAGVWDYPKWRLSIEAVCAIPAG